MKPIKFKDQNITFAKEQPQYQPLPALKLNTPEGHVITCWKLSFKERIKVLFFGVVWMNILTFNKALQPSLLSTDRKKMFSLPNDNIKWKWLKRKQKELK